MTLALKLGETRKKLHEKLIAMVEEKIPAVEAKPLVNFIYQYFSTVASDDLAQHDISDLYGAVISHWRLMYKRKPGETKLRIYNPQYEKHGWQSSHTIIEILHDDMPFLVDSIQMELNRRGLTTHLLIHVGGMIIERDDNNEIKNILPAGSKKKMTKAEAPLFFEIDKQTDPNVLNDLEQSILDILKDVRLTVQDWKPILQQVDESMAQLKECPPDIKPDELKETIEFLLWLKEHHFTFMGCRDSVLEEKEGGFVLKALDKTGLGVLRKNGTKHKLRSLSDMTPEARKEALSQQPLVITKTKRKSTVHRPAYTDCIIVKKYDKNGKIIGETRFIGLFTSAAYNRNPQGIPLLRQKVETIISQSKLSKTGHAGKALLNILETFPRDDLFQTSTDELLKLSVGILHLQERRRIRLFIRKEPYGRFISCFVYVPRDLYHTELREGIQELLGRAFDSSEASFATWFSDSILARIHFVFRVDSKKQLEFDVKELEEKIVEVSRSWHDELSEYLRESSGEEKGNFLLGKYSKGFPAGYREATSARMAVYDVFHLENLDTEHAIEMSLFRPIDESEHLLRFKLFTLNEPIALSKVMPILENMGLIVIGEQSYKIGVKGGGSAWISDFTMYHESIATLNIDEVKNTFQEAFAGVWYSRAENDGLNRLVLIGNLDWREISVMRAYKKYLKQIGFALSQSYIDETLSNNSQITKMLVDLFILRFAPKNAKSSNSKVEKLEEKIIGALDSVESLDEDRILRHFHSAIMATLRTNFYQKDSAANFKEYFSFKLDSNLIPDMPRPKPMFEVFVYSPRVEGIHLRTSKVARGGLRWSDRLEDFRTEVLGLMKAQKVKNSVIVPSGAKGGFVTKSLPLNGTREEVMKEVVSCYKLFIRGLLDITDNFQGGEITHPKNTVIYDDPDPYLVVAADKGTATFSNYANQVSVEYDHWLGDAFASGGETGYDHKKMGITAKGAWESVKRHFRELGIDTQKEAFTVVGIGDMSGDVFGNGMLLSEHIKLLAGFNHLHIFVDPDPDPKTSFEERKRLFELPRSSWDDYDPKLISKGGGIFSRAAKSIPLSAQIKQLIGVDKNSLEPNELIRHLFRAQYDLLWNGGIGTFVKAESELDVNVGDRTNDLIRVNARELRCRVIGEGGNLGITQLARTEYALNGGHVYTDFIDNSAGVDCSDHEVNIKILLNEVVANGDMTEKQRNKLLADMTTDVGTLVLKNNYVQTRAVSLAEKLSMDNFDLFSRFIQELEGAEKIDREIEFLPDNKQLMDRKSKDIGLTRPEIAVLLAYSKMILKDEILASDIPEDDYIAKIIHTAFPEVLNKKFKKPIEKHSLNREIIATQLSNAVINDMGITFPFRVNEETGDSFANIARAYYVANEVFGLQDLWKKIEELDYTVSSDMQDEMILSIARVMRRATRWFLRNHRSMDDIPKLIALYKPGIDKLHGTLPDLIMGAAKEHLDETIDRYIEAGVPESTALLIANSMAMYSVLDIISASNEHGFDPKHVATTYFGVGAALDLAWFRWMILKHPAENHWETVAKSIFRDDIDWQQRKLTVSVLKHYSQGDVEKNIHQWCESHETLVDRWKKMFAELRGSRSCNFVMFAVAIRGLLDLTQSCEQDNVIDNNNSG